VIQVTNKHEVVVQKWEESERGWGTRPDGYSLHLTEKDREAFVKAYWKGMPSEAPDEYSRPDGTPYTTKVCTKHFTLVKKSKNGVTFIGTPPRFRWDKWVEVDERSGSDTARLGFVERTESDV
jgi:hypothetical protein